MKQHRTSKILFFILTLMLLVCVGLYILWTGSLFGKKLPQFSNETQQVTSSGQIQYTPGTTLEVPVVTPMISATSITLSSPTSIPDDVKPVCGQRDPLTILVLGIDENEQSDVIRLVRVDFIQKRILVLSIPRDFWVPIPDLGQFNINEFKINAAYGYGEYFFGSGQGVVETSKTIYQNYGVNFDRYVVFHFSNFERMIDAVGGLDIFLDEPIGAYGTAGLTHLDGKTALDYARNRNADNDLYRIKRQTEIIKSLFSKLILPENLLKLPGLGLEFVGDKTLITDFSIRDVSTFVCLAGELGNVSLVMRDIPTDLYQSAHTNTGRFIFIPSSQVTNFIQELVINGNY